MGTGVLYFLCLQCVFNFVKEWYESNTLNIVFGKCVVVWSAPCQHFEVPFQLEFYSSGLFVTHVQEVLQELVQLGCHFFQLLIICCVVSTQMEGNVISAISMLCVLCCVSSQEDT